MTIEIDVSLRDFLNGYSKLNKTFETYGNTFKKLPVYEQKSPKLIDEKTTENMKNSFERLSSFSDLINKNRKFYNPISNSDSSKFWKNYSKSIKQSIQTPEMEKTLGSTTTKKIVKELDDASKNFDSAEKGFAKKTQLKDASEKIQDYNRSMAEVGLTSKYLTSMANDFSELYGNEVEPSLLGKIKEKLIGIWNRIKKSIFTIIDRIKEPILNLGQDITMHLKELEKSLSLGLDKAKEKITAVFDKISEKFHKMIEILLQKMFEFLNRFSEIAGNHGYGVTKVQVKLPSIRLEPHGLFPIPIPTIDPPDITVDISALSKTS